MDRKEYEPSNFSILIFFTLINIELPYAQVKGNLHLLNQSSFMQRGKSCLSKYLSHLVVLLACHYYATPWFYCSGLAMKCYC
jgi:hypothetical protein